MRNAVVTTAILVVIAGCSAPAPNEPTATASVAESDREAAATSAGLSADQLVPLDDGFVAASFDAGSSLQLIWVRPGAQGFETSVLVTLDEQRAEGTSRISTHPVSCAADVGLTRTRFIVGQATEHDALQMSGLPAVGGQVVDDAYVFAIDPTASSAGWSLQSADGQQVATADPSWFTSSPLPPTEGELCSSVAEH